MNTEVDLSLTKEFDLWVQEALRFAQRRQSGQSFHPFSFLFSPFSPLQDDNMFCTNLCTASTHTQACVMNANTNLLKPKPDEC
jgi:hypothetical protein